jgi:Rieske Fe-S protein
MLLTALRSTRRKFLNWLLGTGFGALVASIVYPVGRYLVPPATEEAETRSVTLPMRPEEVAPDSGQIFKFGNDPGILIRTPGGELRAFSAICTHLSCIVQYRADFDHIWCACHNGHYDLHGRNIKGPPPRPLEAYDVTVAGEEIIVGRRA